MPQVQQPRTRAATRRAKAPSVDWRRMGRRLVMFESALFAVALVYLSVKGGHYGSDFHGGAWKAGRDILAGRPIYAPAKVGTLLALRSAFIPPPLLALIAVPFSALPFPLAVALWSTLCTGAFAGALWLLGVRDWRFYLIALSSYPFIASLIFGQPDGLLALALALVWRYRDSARGAVSAGALIAAKLLAWPLVVWFLATRRVHRALVTAVATAGFLIVSWACIGFEGLTGYPALLSADARAFEAKTYSPVAEVMRMGGSASLARVLAVGLAALVLFAAVRNGRGSDQAWFAGVLAFGLLTSPLLEMCYLVLLFVPLAVSRSRPDRLVWLTALFWLAPWGLWPANLRVVQVAVVIALTGTTAVLAASGPFSLALRSRVREA